MGSLTNLEKNKTLFVPCGCGSEILAIEYDHDSQMADFAIYTTIAGYNHKMSLWQKIRYCYEVFVNGKPYADQILLDSTQLRDLQKFLNSLELQK